MLKLLSRITEFIRPEAASSVVLLGCMVFALVWANSPLRSSYFEVWGTGVLGFSFLHWINDGLMALFFLVVGLEIRRELTVGELSSRSKAALPFIAAMGGMIVPAAFFAALNTGFEGGRAWGVPMATDIAFALGVLGLLGKRVPSGLKVFLMALAIVDDLGAVLVIALFYTQQLSGAYLLGATGLLAILYLLGRRGVGHVGVYLAVGIAVWLCFLRSGVHATVAGVLLAMVVPAGTGHRLERRLHSWVAFLIMPLFALANAGVSFAETTLLHRTAAGIGLGLFLGKQVGITLFSWCAIKLGVAVLPRQVSWRQLYGAACLGGIGFTMSIFIAQLALSGPLLSDAKAAIFLASVASACVGAFVLRATAPATP